MGKYRELILKEDDVKIETVKAFHNFDDDDAWNRDLNEFIDIIEAKQQRTFTRISKSKKAGIVLGQRMRDALLSNPEKSKRVGTAIGKAISSSFGD